MKRAPPPAARSTAIVPRCATTIERAMARPSPLPPRLAVAGGVQAHERLEDPRGVGRIDTRAGVLDDDTASAPSATTDRSTRPPAGVYFTPFSTRFRGRPAQGADVAQDGQWGDGPTRTATLRSLPSRVPTSATSRTSGSRSTRARGDSGPAVERESSSRSSARRISRSTSSSAETSAARYSTPERSARSVDFERALERGERRAQLVGGVGREAAHARRTCSPAAPACR